MRGFLLAIGVAYTFVQPPFTPSEEREHMALVSELARFELASPHDAAGPYHQVDAELERLASTYEPLTTDSRARTNPSALLDDLRAHVGEQRTLRAAPRMPRIGRLADLPLLPAFWLGRALDLSLLTQLYLARLGGLACFALLAGYAISNAGPLGFAFFALSALPQSLAQAASLSGEALCGGLSLCFFALIAKGRYAREPGLDERERIVLLALLLALALCQPLFTAAALCLRALPSEAPVRPVLRGARLCALGFSLSAAGVAFWIYTNTPTAGATGGAVFLREHPITALLGFARGALLQIDSLSIAFAAFSGSLVDQARFSGGVITALGGELVLLLAWGAAPRARVAAPGQGWLLSGLLVYLLSLLMLVQLTQATAGTLALDTVSVRSAALFAPAALLLLSSYGRPSLVRYLTAQPVTRVVGPLLFLNIVALAALIGRYFVPAKFAWPY